MSIYFPLIKHRNRRGHEDVINKFEISGVARGEAPPRLGNNHFDLLIFKTRLINTLGLKENSHATVIYHRRKILEKVVGGTFEIIIMKIKTRICIIIHKYEYVCVWLALKIPRKKNRFMPVAKSGTVHDCVTHALKPFIKGCLKC